MSDSARRSHWTAVCVATAAVLIAAPLSAAPALALPGPMRQDATLALPSVGLGKTLSFPGRDATVMLNIPVPTGMTPVGLRGWIQVPPGAGRGWIDTVVNGRTIGRTDIPSDVPSAPVTLPLTGAPIADNAVQVQLRSHLAPVDDHWCAEDWWDNALSITDASVDYTGDETQPTVVADFLPPVLRQLDLYVPAQPTHDESAAALEFATAMAARFADQQPTIDLRSLAPGESLPEQPVGLLERQVVLQESDTAAATLSRSPAGVPVLTLSGRGQSLLDQTRLLDSNLAWLSVASSAAAGSLAPAPQLAPSLTTLAALGQGDLSATSAGLVRVTIGLDQPRLGRPSGSVRVHLQGNYTPPPTNQHGQITVTVGDTTVDSWSTDGDGRIDRWIDVPDRALSRYSEMAVTLQAAGAMTCGSTQPLTLSIDPASTVSSDRTTPPNPGGFQALPQALMPTVDVGLQHGTFADLRRAVTIADGLQSMTTARMRPELVDFDDAVSSSNPAILVAADGGLPNSVPLPLTVGADGKVELRDPTGKAPTEIVDVPGLRFGSLQAAWDSDRNRMLVVATSTGDPAAVDRVLNWLSADPNRWSTLTGDAVFQTGDRDPIALPAPAQQQPAPAKSSTHVGGVLIAGAAVLVVGLLGAAAVLIGSRRRRPRP